MCGCDKPNLYSSSGQDIIRNLAGHITEKKFHGVEAWRLLELCIHQQSKVNLAIPVCFGNRHTLFQGFTVD